MAKQCPNCRSIVSTATADCSCGFRFFNKDAAADAFAKNCMRIGGGVFLIACLAVVALRFL